MRQQRGRSAAAYAATWVAVVVIASTLAWQAIQHAGRESTLLGAPAGAVGMPPASATGSSAAPTSLPVATGTGMRPTTPAPTVTATSVGTSGSGHSNPSKGTSHSSSASGSSGSTSTGPVTQEDSVNTRGGSVSVACTGDRLSLRYARPAEGWQLDGPEREGSGIEVKFKREEDEEIEVKASCQGGRPRLVVS